jgi:hypothetical protein
VAIASIGVAGATVVLALGASRRPTIASPGKDDDMRPARRSRSADDQRG